MDEILEQQQELDLEEYIILLKNVILPYLLILLVI